MYVEALAAQLLMHAAASCEYAANVPGWVDVILERNRRREKLEK